MMSFAALGINYARQGAARHSSVYKNAERAIDGKTGGTSKHASCIITSVDYSPWWIVYLKKIISVSVVIIQNRYDWRGKYLLWYYWRFFF